MEEQLISFETAKLAKEKRFDVPTLRNYLEDTLDDFNIFNNTPFDFNNTKDEGGNIIEEHPFSSAPTQSLLQKWLREKYNIHINIYASGVGLYATVVNQIIKTGPGAMDYKYNQADAKGSKYKNGNHDTYEEALEAGLQKALKLIK